jgi:hypothetical protein
VRIDQPPDNFQYRKSSPRVPFRAVAISEEGEPVTDVEVRVNGRPVRFEGKPADDAWSESNRTWTRSQWISLKEGLNTIVFFARTRRASSVEARVSGTYTSVPVSHPVVVRVAKPYLGLIPDQRNVFKTGAYLLGTHFGSPAEKAGIRSNDRLDVFNGRTIRTWEDYKAALGLCRPGQTVKLDVVRVTTPMSFTIVIGTGDED